MARILVIDDEELVRVSIEVVLSASGHAVSLAADGREGLDQLAKGDFDLIITDLIMRGMEGVETILAIRKQSSAARILVMSGGSRRINGNYLGTSAKLGADRILRKPFSNVELLEAVNRTIAIAFTAAKPAPGPSDS